MTDADPRGLRRRDAVVAALTEAASDPLLPDCECERDTLPLCGAHVLLACDAYLLATGQTTAPRDPVDIAAYTWFLAYATVVKELHAHRYDREER